jgi:integron integrase
MKRNELIAREVERARCVIRRQHKALATERAYCGWLKRYFNFVFSLPRDWTSEKKVEAFLTMLAKDDVSASTQNGAFHAIRFFYEDVIKKPLEKVAALRATRPAAMRHALPVEDTRRLLDSVKNRNGYPINMIVRMLYGCGLRVSEPLNIRIKDVDMENSSLFILGAKGGKDRVVRLPCSLAVEIQQQMDYARAVWSRDNVAKIPVQLPGQLGKKYPEYQFAWGWAWLFPSHHPCRDPRSGRLVRWHLHPANIQRGVKEARRELGLVVTPHNLRHCYATHNLNRGVNMKSLQEAMGHSNIQTTSGYCHAEALSVPSPLDMTGRLG